MDGRVLVPWEQNRANAPAGLRVDVYDGDAPPPGDLSDVVLYVLPYGRRHAADLLPRMPRLRAAQLLTAGYEHVLDVLPDGAALHNGRGLHDASTAEHALALILAAQRELPRWADDQRRRVWRPHYTRSLADARVLIVGYGSIGAAIEDRLRPFEAEAVRVARRPRPDQEVHGIADLHGLLPEADIVVVVAPHTPETTGLIGATELALLRDDALVVNVGRGPVLDTGALLAEKGRIRAALDVTDPEPLPADHPLWTAPGVFVTPHVAGGSATFYPRARRFVDEQLRRWAAGEPLANPVRLDTVGG
ncbi:2-hydroxyacid dehydrogenase [Marinitenerispora sediminis]|uniref:Dihydrofolate reductase n=1 Tax=Marinitenerispora sediminis TaxID=1931232 RepID=A0A368T6C1_9ACTN|nr:2-hydroxyacid dehydrogenase [Marinitenerispora sediminis]RCV52214.1 dihydrofolate reductase [Marinitenerispora sediminis]RCV55603.1 dihydrofolate reductase [Marinitenerispora sediminis]RCV59198.1 dihydrofolate reductase [Marinitenerispora sediminis]